MAIGFVSMQMPIYINVTFPNDYFVGGLLLLTISIAASFAAMILSFFFQNVNFNMEDSIMSELKKFLEQESGATYERLGLKWEIGDHFYWLELNDLEE